jgi:hypothetical protein
MGRGWEGGASQLCLVVDGSGWGGGRVTAFMKDKACCFCYRFITKVVRVFYFDCLGYKSFCVNKNYLIK